MFTDTGLSLCQETAERKLEAKVTELQQLTEEVKMLKDSVQQETEENKKLQAVIMDKDVCLAEKEELVGRDSGLASGAQDITFYDHC